MSNNYTVYMHRTPSNKVYIGITGVSPEVRWNKGIGYKRHRYFKYAVEKYGWDNIEHIIIATGLSKEAACDMEIELIKEYQSTNREFGYNCSSGGEFGNSGVGITEEGRRRLRESRLGKHLSEESKRKIGDANRGRTHIVTEETKQRLRESFKHRVAHKQTAETRAKIGAASRGHTCHHTDATRQHLSEVMRGRVYIHNDLDVKFVRPEELEYYVSLGYVRGYKRKDKQNA